MWLTLFDGLRRGGQPWTIRVWLGTLIGLLGVALVAKPQGGVEAGHWPAVIGLQVGALSWTFGSLYAQAGPKRLPLPRASAVEMVARAGVRFLGSLLLRE